MKWSVAHSLNAPSKPTELYRQHIQLHREADAKLAKLAKRKAERPERATGTASVDSRVQWLLVQQEIFFAVTAVALALAAGSAVFIEQCRQRDVCIASSRCMRLTAVFGCGFVTVADASTSIYYNNASVVCAPGEAFDPVAASCMLLRPFPDALNRQAFGDRAGSCSEAACGAWARGGTVPSGQSEVYMSAASHSTFEQQTTDLLIDVASRPHLTASSMSAAIQRCKVDAHDGSSGLRASSKRAYTMLKARIDASATPAAGAGALGSGGCPSIANVGVLLLESGMQLLIADDVLLNSHHFRTFTDTMDEHSDVASDATEMLNRMNVDMRQHILGSDIDEYLAGYFGVGTEEGADALPTMLNPNPVVYSPATYYFPAFLSTAQTMPTLWKPLLYVLAASCAQALEASIPTVTMPYASMRAHRAKPFRPERLPPAFLHHAPLEDEHSSDIEALSSLANATFRGIDHVAYELTSASSLSSVATDCVKLGLTFFPDEQKHILFNRVVGTRLYNRLQPIVQTLRDGVMIAMDSPLAKSMFNSTDAARSCVNNTLVRIPGAPRKTWAARNVQEPQVQFSSDNTVFEMIVLQASALQRERVEAVMTSTTLAEYWIETSPTARNAFVYALADAGFMLIYLGMLTSPYANPRAHRLLCDSNRMLVNALRPTAVLITALLLADYSDASLAVRVGAVIAHELAHCTTVLPNEIWNSQPVHAALSGYLELTHKEAMADIIGVAGVLESGVVDWPTLKDHWGQLFCSRRAPSYQEPSTGVHPSSLRRVDELAKIIDRFYPR